MNPTTGRAGPAGAAALAALGTQRLLRHRLPAGARVTWTRTNFRGDEVTLLAGPAYAAGALLVVGVAPGLRASQRGAAALAVGAAAGLGAYDDLHGSAGSRGLRGHASALARGDVTTGAVKVLGIGAAGLLAGRLLHRAPVDALAAGVVIAGTANVLNLLDLRPGRALKAGLLIGAPLSRCDDARGRLAAAAMGAAAGLLPDDLAARTMLGDAGANALGALLGVAIATSAPRRTLLVAAVTVTALTGISERVSFTEVIARTPGLRQLDELGRRRADR